MRMLQTIVGGASRLLERAKNAGLRLATSLVLMLLAGHLSGCAKATLSHQALALNKTVHNHRVNQLLLNVVRASLYEPMAMTTIGSFVQRNTDTKRASFDFNFGYMASDLYDSTVSSEYKQNPEMTMTILDNQKDFIQGFMEPIPGETISFFVKQGMDMEFLAYLVVEAIEIPISDIPPAELQEMKEKFPARIRRNAQGLDFIRVPNNPKSDNSVFDRLIKLNVGNMEIRQEEAPPARGARVAEPILVDKFVIPGVRAELVIRSPHGVLTYLGELARMAQDPAQRQRIPRIEGDYLFLISKFPKSPDNSQVSVQHRGSFYTIPANPPNRSMAALNLVQQLIDLQEKKIDQNPGTLRLIAN